MSGSILAKVRGFLVRGLAVAAVVVTYAVGGIATQVATVVGISSLALTTTATPAQAYYRYGRRRFRRYRYFRRRPVFVRRRRFYAPRRRFRRRWYY